MEITPTTIIILILVLIVAWAFYIIFNGQCSSQTINVPINSPQQHQKQQTQIDQSAIIAQMEKKILEDVAKLIQSQNQQDNKLSECDQILGIQNPDNIVKGMLGKIARTPCADAYNKAVNKDFSDDDIRANCSNVYNFGHFTNGSSRNTMNSLNELMKMQMQSDQTLAPTFGKDVKVQDLYDKITMDPISKMPLLHQHDSDILANDPFFESHERVRF